ncbi:hypothetical protein L1887_42862 [Cichorium endivia]|nr:hypothetical protein L1887_42862 [Cichorium endivia]
MSFTASPPSTNIAPHHFPLTLYWLLQRAGGQFRGTGQLAFVIFRRDRFVFISANTAVAPRRRSADPAERARSLPFQSSRDCRASQSGHRGSGYADHHARIEQHGSVGDVSLGKVVEAPAQVNGALPAAGEIPETRYGKRGGSRIRYRSGRCA